MAKNSPSLSPTVRLGALLVLIFVLAACGSKAGSGPSAEKTVSDFVHRVNKIVRNDEASWPNDVPDDVPAFSQGRIVAAEKGLTPNGTSWTIRVADVAEPGFQDYVDLLRRADWDVSGSETQEGGHFAASKEGLSLTLAYAGARGTLVVLWKTF